MTTTPSDKWTYADGAWTLAVEREQPGRSDTFTVWLDVEQSGPRQWRWASTPSDTHWDEPDAAGQDWDYSIYYQPQTGVADTLSAAQAAAEAAPIVKISGYSKQQAREARGRRLKHYLIWPACAAAMVELLTDRSRWHAAGAALAAAAVVYLARRIAARRTTVQIVTVRRGDGRGETVECNS